MRPSITITIALLLACSPKTDDADETSASASSSSSTDTPTSTDAPTSTDPTGDVCVDPAETEFGPSVAITIRNDSDAPLFILTQSFCASVLPVTLFAGDAELVISPGSCDFSCADVLSGNCGCPAGCGDPEDVVQIAPGGVYTDTWSGINVVPFELDASCFTEDCGNSCTAERQTPPGSYTMRATAATAVDNCEPPCTCTANADGWCIFEASPSGADIVVEVPLEYPSQTAASLTFD